MRVLVVEDEVELAELVAIGLRRHGMAVDVAFAGDEALAKLDVNDYDVLVLDRDLPVVPGDDVCRAVVASSASTRILMLTAAADTRDLVSGLGLGADDYLAKPFEFDELVAMAQALGRRAAAAVPPVLTHGELVLDIPRHRASRAGSQINLSRKEFAVLETLMGARGSVVSAEALLEKVWDENADPFTNAVRITVSRLRAKLGEPPLIETIPGLGYRI
ncbi:MAG TPA: response regulator transcription factor [Pseudonocardiaceae bacterium]|nr:response regulator transcription factor [Pseudonocardiaceae bacterium]